MNAAMGGALVQDLIDAAAFAAAWLGSALCVLDAAGCSGCAALLRHVYLFSALVGDRHMHMHVPQCLQDCN